MKRYCITKEKKIAPIVLLEAYKHYIPCQVSDDGKKVDNMEPSLPDSGKAVIEENSLSKEDSKKMVCNNQIKDCLPIFPECESEIMRLFISMGKCDAASDEDEMYGDILKDIFSSDIVDLDIKLHIYYTLLYEINKNSFIPLTEENWSREDKEDLRKKRKECNRRKSEEERKPPFEIREQGSENNKKGNEETMIQNFAPNVCRQYYWSKEFRNIFRTVKTSIANKYKFSEVKELLLMERNFFDKKDVVFINRKEEIWLCEKVLGINLALAFYSFFAMVFQGMEFKTIENEYKDIMHKIIGEVMSLKGIYSRCAIVHKLKVIYELRKKSNLYTSYDNPENLLEYLYNQVLLEYMSECAKQYEYIEIYKLKEYKNVKEMDGTSVIETLEKDCEKLLEKYFVFSEGYYYIREFSKEIENERIYALIQNMVVMNKI